MNTMDDKEFLEQLGRRIAELRKEKGWTQEEFSEKMSVKRSALARIEVGSINTTILNLKKISDALKIPIQKIIETD